MLSRVLFVAGRRGANVTAGMFRPMRALSTTDIEKRDFKLLDPSFPTDDLPESVKRVLALSNATNKERTEAQAKTVAHAFRMHDADVGSTRVQVARLTVEINALDRHLAVHKKDVHCKRGRDVKVTKRRKLLKYLKRVDGADYIATMRALEIPLPKIRRKKQRLF